MKFLKYLFLTSLISLLVSCDSGDKEDAKQRNSESDSVETYDLDDKNRVRIILTSSDNVESELLLKSLGRLAERYGEKNVMASFEDERVCILSFEYGNTDLRWVKYLDVKYSKDMMAVYEVVEGSDRIVSENTQPNGDFDVSVISMGHIVLPYKRPGVHGPKYTILKRTPIVNRSDVKQAWVDPSDFTVINVQLTNDGGDKMRDATSRMTAGVSRLAVVYDGKAVNVATLNARELGRNFVITGLDTKDEAEEVVRALKWPINGFEKVEVILPESATKPEKSPAPAE